jgi:hypothetical protein
MGQLQIGGALSGGPLTVSDGQFASASFLCALSFQQGSTKGSGAASGAITRQLASPSSYALLQGVGADSSVLQGNTLYFKSDGPVLLRITCDDGSGGDAVSILPVSGLLVFEVDPNQFIKALACQGTAALEYLVSGDK